MRFRLHGVSGAATLLAVLAVLAVAAVAGTAAMTAVTDEPSGAAVLNDTYDRYAAAESVVGSADVTVRNRTANATASVEFAAAGNGSRVTVVRNDSTYRAGTNGTVAWYVGPNRSRAWTVDALRERARDRPGPDAIADPTRSPHLNRSAVEAELLRTGSDDGVEAYVVRVTPANGTSDLRATLWVAQSDARLLRAEMTDGTNATVVDYRDVQFNASVHPSTFDPPSDRIPVTTVERYDGFDALQANTSLDVPALDASFRGAAVTERAAGVAVAQQYRAAGDNVTVVSTTIDREFDPDEARSVTVNGHDATVATVRDAAIVYWRIDGVTTAVVVDAGEDRALELAGRLDE